MKAKEDTTKVDFILFANNDSLKDYQYERVSDKDTKKMVYFISKSISGNTALGGICCRIDKDGRIDPCEYKKIEQTSQERGFIGFVKEEHI